MRPRLGLLLDERFQRHQTGRGHPERPARLDAVRAALEWNGALSTALQIEPIEIEQSVVQRLHTPDYLDRLEQACRAHAPYIDTPDSAICPESAHVARLAAGGVVETARALGRGLIDRAFCAVRPPGHHAERDRSMGFCLLNNVALAADVLRREYHLNRILILDWDVHHGNGTQHLFESDPQVFFISLHGHPDHLYPGTGYEHERGTGPGEGYTLNVPFRPGARDEDYRNAFRQKVLPAAEAYRPEIVLLSAGFDAHQADPIGCAALTDEAFVWMLQETRALANRYAGGRILSVLEGGYDLDALRRCVADHVSGLLEP